MSGGDEHLCGWTPAPARRLAFKGSTEGEAIIALAWTKDGLVAGGESGAVSHCRTAIPAL
jgi:hypothetical protein